MRARGEGRLSTVLYLNLYPAIGGAERALLELVSALDRGRYRPLAVVAAPGPLVDALGQRDVETSVLPFPTPPLSRLLRPDVARRVARASAQLARLVTERGVRLVHCGDALALLLLRPARRRGVRVLLQLHYLGAGLRAVALNLLALGIVDRVAAYSEDQRRALAARTLGLAGRASVVRPGIRPEDFAAGDRRRGRAALGLPDAAPVVGMLGRFDVWKGHATFLQAARRVRQARPEARFVIAGGALNQESLPHVARYRAQVVAQLGELGLQDAVRLCDHRDDVPDVLAALDVLALPSEREPFGMVLIEAMAAGTPVVASASGGPLEIVEDGVSGLLFPCGDAGALAERLLGLLADPGRRGALAEGGRRRVQASFRRERYAREMEALYAGMA